MWIYVEVIANNHLVKASKHSYDLPTSLMIIQMYLLSSIALSQ